MTVSDKMRDIVNKINYMKQKQYIKSVYDDIKRAAKSGERSVCTTYLDRNYDWTNNDFVNSIQDIFEKDGFTVEKRTNQYGNLYTYWRITW